MAALSSLIFQRVVEPGLNQGPQEIWADRAEIQPQELAGRKLGRGEGSSEEAKGTSNVPMAQEQWGAGKHSALLRRASKLVSAESPAQKKLSFMKEAKSTPCKL